ncbi:MAG: WecB/TagA/CpsF family glycosyltransferase [Fimbriimonadaceae bacterium]|nr:WecB/TagA/CpsF family glycosyltransferase [Fimbriimonadaceae bacterium]QYK55047.1 MAG: WecB/TagA/CpsF family glycosyltransferase [Fimbriimonadaceae bacterium]
MGVPISTLDMDGTLDAVESLIASKTAHQLVTADAAGLVQALEDAELARIYRSSAIATPDSQGVVWAMKRAGANVQRVSGVDLLDRICALSADKGYRVFFLGAEPGVAQLAAERLMLRHPGCNVVGTHHGFFPAEDDSLVAQEVARAKPDVLFVAMGIPRQEKFIARTLGATGAKVSVGVGGSLDVFSGRVKRAPRLIQAVKAEWVWRLLLNPKKLDKVRLLPRFALEVLRSSR